MHLHCNNLGAPGNISTTLDTLKHLEGRRAHIAHSQYHAYGGDGWDTMCSETAQLAEYFNTHPGITTDAGAVLFGDTVTITADGPWQHLLYKLTGRKWGNLDVENETGCGIVPYTYRPAIWSTPCSGRPGWSCCCSSTIPGRCFSRPIIPTAAASGGIRRSSTADVRRGPQGAHRRSCPDQVQRNHAAEIDREYTLFEVAIVMSAGPARALGLTQKGNLGVGSDADVVIYEGKDGQRRRMFGHPRYVIKGGEIVIEDGEIRGARKGASSS